MRLWHILQSRLRSLFLRARRESDLREELALHLDRERERLEAVGMDPDAARFQALRTFGAVESTKDACRDARGTALLDNLVRDVRYAGRSFRRAPLAALTIATTVGLGLGLVAVVFTIFNAFVFLVDEVHDPYALFAVERPRSANAKPETFTHSQYDALVRESGIFTDAFARTPEIDSWIEGRRLEGPLVTGNFFQVLGVSAARGRTLVPSDDEPGGRPVIVLSHRAWTRHFAGDPGVLDRTVLVNGAPFQIVGVMPPGFRGLTVAPPDYWAPLSLLGHFRTGPLDTEDAAGLQVVGRLKPGLSRGQAIAPLTAWDSRRAAEGRIERPAANLVLESQLGTVPQPAEAVLVFMPLFFAFGLILLIACANVANLLLARGVARQREIGIRLSIGASRRRVIWQLLTENLLLALAAAALGFGIVAGRARGDRLRVDEHVSTRLRQHPPGRPAGGLAGRAVPGRRRDALDRVLRARSGASGHAGRAGAGDSRRGGAGRPSRPCPGCARRAAGDGLRPAPDLRRGVPAQHVGGSDRRSGYPHDRHRQRAHPERATARGHPRRGEAGGVGRLGCGLVAGRAGRPRGVCGRPAGQVAGHLPVRVPGVLRHPGHRSGARTRVHRRGAQRSRSGRGRVRERRTPAVAQGRRHRAGGAARAGREARSTGAG